MEAGDSYRSASRTAYRLAPVPDEHRERSMQMILQAADAVEPQRVIVLGAGRCEEIPLLALADRFTTVVLQDIDSSLLEAGIAAAELPVGDPTKIQAETIDLIGITDAITEQCQQAIDQAVDVDQAIGRVSEIVAGAQPVMASSERHELMIASCVLSQLAFGLIQNVRRQIGDRFVESQPALQNHPQLTQAFDKLTRQCEAAFVDFLASSASVGGRIFFSDTVQMCFVRLTDQGDWITPGTWRMTKSLQLDHYLDDRFEILARARWNWVVNPPVSIGDEGRLYDVQAMILGPGNGRTS